ncbi:MAG: hypothetical protein U1F83_02580 [Verrucomicrobiota bacterium]
MLLVAAVVGDPVTARWLTTEDGQLRLRLPASAEPTRGKILLWGGPREALSEFAALVKSSSAPADLELPTRGGLPRWPEKLLTHGQLGTNEGPYAIDTLTIEPTQIRGVPGCASEEWTSSPTAGGRRFPPGTAMSGLFPEWTATCAT